MNTLISQISVSTSVTVSRFLAQNLHTVISALDACVVSVLIIAASYALGPDLQMSVLSRRLAALLLAHQLQQAVALGFDVESVIVSAGLLAVVSLVPLNLSKEIETIITSIVYMYSDVLSFLVSWRRERLSVLVTLILLFRGCHRFIENARLRQVACFSLMTAVGNIVLDSSDEPQTDVILLRYSLFLVVLHAATADIAHEIEDSCLLAYVNFVTVVFADEPFITTVCAFFVSLVCRHAIGLHAWPTRVATLVCVNVLVQTTLSYMKRLAVNDTFVTLKTTALVVQFVVHLATKWVASEE